MTSHRSLGAALVACAALFLSAPSVAQQAAAKTSPETMAGGVATGKQEAEAKLREEEKKLAGKAATEDEARRKREEAEEKHRVAKAEAETKRRERERSCAIRPVMTDAEISNCKEVWR